MSPYRTQSDFPHPGLTRQVPVEPSSQDFAPLPPLGPRQKRRWWSLMHQTLPGAETAAVDAGPSRDGGLPGR